MAIYKLKDICLKIGSGATPRGGKEAYCNEGISLIRSQNVLDFTFSYDGLAHINDQQAEKLSNVEVKPQDILLNITGDSVARVCTVDPRTLPARVNQHVAIIRPDENRVLSSYILYFLQMIKPYLLQIAAGGATRNALTKSMIENLELEVPDILSQKKIVSILDDIQEKIRDNNEINKNLEQQAKALFKSWFVAFEPFNGTMPSDWEIVPLEKIADFQNGYAFKSKELLNKPSADCYQVFKQGHIARGGGFILDGTKSWYPKSLASKLEKFVLKKGDILMAMTDMKDNVAILGNTAIIPLDNEYIVNQRVGHLRANGYKGVTYPFIYLLTNSTDFLVDLRSRANSGVQVNLSSSEIKASQTVLPSEEVNNSFSDITLPMFEIIINNQLENQRLTQLRDTLLPKLMSGELDVYDIDL